MGSARKPSVLLAMTLLVGCGSSPSPASSVAEPAEYGQLPTDVVVHPVRDDAAVAVQRSYHDDGENHRARCMRSEGFEYRQRPFSLADVAADNPIDANLPWEAQRAWVAELGYGITEGLLAEQEASSDPNATYIARLPQGEIDAFYRTLDSCDVSPDAPAPPSAPVEPMIEATVRRAAAAIQNDEEWLAAGDLWIACMAERGHRFGNRIEAPESIAAALDALLQQGIGPGDDAFETLRREELALAADDLRCQIEVVAAARRAIEERINRDYGLID